MKKSSFKIAQRYIRISKSFQKIVWFISPVQIKVQQGGKSFFDHMGIEDLPLEAVQGITNFVFSVTYCQLGLEQLFDEGKIQKRGSVFQVVAFKI